LALLMIRSLSVQFTRNMAFLLDPFKLPLELLIFNLY